MAVRGKQTKRNFWRLNQNIQASRLRVIDEEGKQLGLFSAREAYEMAQSAGLDIVEIAPLANPPVAKIIDFTKFKYQQDKKEREARRKEKKGAEQKEVWLTPFIGDNDYQTRLAKMREFLTEGSKVRIVVKFRGNQMSHKEFGFEIAKRVVTDTKDIAGIDQDPKFLGRQLVMMLTPVKKKAVQTDKSETETANI